MPRGSYKRNVVAVFYGTFQGSRELHKNRGSHPERMVLHCIKHMRKNTYGALLAEVFTEGSTKSHAVIKRKINGRVEVLYSENLDIQRYGDF